jgi:hypothetical protein
VCRHADARRAYGVRVERAGARGAARAFPGRRGHGLTAGAAVLLAGGMVVLAGCSSGGAGTSVAGAGATCGTTHTAAGVPVVITVARGSVNCGMALKVEDEYAATIRAGHVQGTGGGAPVTVSGWTCQGYNTPQMLRTGDVSQCHTSTAAILAVLPVPTPTAG